MSMFGVRFSFVATRSGLTRVRHHNSDDPQVKREALAFIKRHARAVDETYYSRTIDYNMLMNETATLVQVPFNTHRKILERLSKFESESQAIAAYESVGGGAAPADPTIGGPGGGDLADEQLELPAGGAGAGAAGGAFGSRLSVKDMNLFEKLELLANSSLHVIATESLVVNEGAQRAIAGVSGVFYDYATFATRLLNLTNARFSSADAEETIKCGHQNDTIDCLLVDNNGYILVSERLEFIGRHLKAYDQSIMQRLVAGGLFREVNITDHQSICVKQEEKQTAAASSAAAGGGPLLSAAPKLGHLFASSVGSVLANALASLLHTWTLMLAVLAEFCQLSMALTSQQQQQQQQNFQTVAAMLPKKSYLRPCDRILTRYELNRGRSRQQPAGSQRPEHFLSSRCHCPGWFVYELVPKTNLVMLVVDSAPVGDCADSARCNNEHGSSKLADGTASSSLLGDTPLEDDSLMSQSNIIGQDEAQVCSMFERDAKLHKKRLDSCISHHKDEEQIKLCGSANPAGTKLEPLSSLLWSLSLFLLSRKLFSFANQ
jgi:hypothetical protein